MVGRLPPAPRPLPSAEGLPIPHRGVHERRCQAEAESLGARGVQTGTQERGPLGSVRLGPSKWGMRASLSRFSPHRPGAWARPAVTGAAHGF